MTDVEHLNRDTFAQHTGGCFRISPDDGVCVELELIEVTDLSSTDPNRDEQVRSQPFSLLFRGAGDPLLEQQVYQLEHDGLGRLELFLVPVGPDKEGKYMCYEAVFN